MCSLRGAHAGSTLLAPQLLPHILQCPYIGLQIPLCKFFKTINIVSHEVFKILYHDFFELILTTPLGAQAQFVVPCRAPVLSGLVVARAVISTHEAWRLLHSTGRKQHVFEPSLLAFELLDFSTQWL